MQISADVGVYRWSILAKFKKHPSMSDREKFGLCNYQMILHQMRLLPCDAYLKPRILDSKDKRKASDDPEEQSPVKKNAFARDEFVMYD
jgi:hypothetical protein